MSSSYESSRSRRRGLWSFWVPVVVTVTVATAGVAAWAWSQREDDEEEEPENEAGLDYENADYGDNPAYGASKDAENNPLSRGVTYGITEPPAEVTGASAGWGAQMSGALRRTPSPQQFLTDAGKRVATSIAGVGAAVGSALAAIREEDKNAYADHETWSEEAEARKERPPAPTQSQSRDVSKRRKTVAIVVSADTNISELQGDGIHEHAVSAHLEEKLPCQFPYKLGHGTDANRCTVHLVPHSPEHRLFQDQVVCLDLLTGSEGCCRRRSSHS